MTETNNNKEVFVRWDHRKAKSNFVIQEQMTQKSADNRMRGRKKDIKRLWDNSKHTT